MHDTGFAVPAAKRDRRAALCGFDNEGRLTTLTQAPGDHALAERPEDMTFESGGQGLWSTLDDYLAFARMLIGDERGILLRDARGRSRAAPNDARAQAATSALVKVLRLDIAELQKTFVVKGERSGETWMLQLVPRDAELAASFGVVTLTGAQSTLERIAINRTDRQQIEILLRERRENVQFSDADLKRYFR